MKPNVNEKKTSQSIFNVLSYLILISYYPLLKGKIKYVRRYVVTENFALIYFLFYNIIIKIYLIKCLTGFLPGQNIFFI